MLNSVGGTLPTPLSSSTPYYLIFLSPTSFQLATTYANAIANAPVTLTGNGTGTLTIISTGVTYLQPNANGYMNTFSSLAHQVLKPTYTDWTGATANTNPIVFDNKGMATIYWEVDGDNALNNYYIEIYTADGVLLYTRDNFNAPPGLETAQDIVSDAQSNLLLNNEFDFWGMYDYGINDISVVTANCSVIAATAVETAYYWHFFKSNDNATDVLTRQLFPAGQTDVPNTPVYFINLACTSAGAGGETSKSFYQNITNVQNLAGQTVTLSFDAMSTTNGTILGTEAYQLFGSGGSAPVTSSGSDFALTTSWATYTTTFTIASLSGQSVGVGSLLQMLFVLPINTTYSISLSQVQLTVSDTVLPYRQMTSDERFAMMASDKQAHCGDVRIQSFGTIPDSWMSFQNGTVGNGSSAATLLASPRTTSLFAALWNTYSDSICPVYDKTGAKVVRGATSLIDYAADYQIQAFFNGGRVIANTGSPKLSFTYTAQIDTVNTITIAAPGLYSDSTLYSGMAVQLVTTGTAPAGLAVATTYYIINGTGISVPTAPTGVYQLSATYNNAIQDQVPIVITDVGTGIQTLVVVDDQTGAPQLITQVAGQATGVNSGLTSSHSVNLNLAGGGVAINLVNPDINGITAIPTTQPTLALPHIIKL